jgi:hypothetical protein
MPSVTTKQVTIPAGGYLSSAADLTSGSVYMIITPPAWTPANVGFLASADNLNFYDVFDSFGMEILRAFGPNRAVMVDPTFTQATAYFKLRSGPLANPVIQDADRIFTLVIK